ncbi:hypothetical protein ACCO45_000412 [Purpureocillium lilacinum]|uniref:Uncharacterized protein n=1 Tax=Purpureocillium lilacinum TaxID=33203 RepID=A0ACC4E5A8_PURLI
MRAHGVGARCSLLLCPPLCADEARARPPPPRGRMRLRSDTTRQAGSTVVQRATPRSLARSPTWGLKIPETNLQSIPRYQGKQTSSAKKGWIIAAPIGRGRRRPPPKDLGRPNGPPEAARWAGHQGSRESPGAEHPKAPADNPTTNAARIQLLSQPAQKPRAALAGPSFCEVRTIISLGGAIAGGPSFPPHVRGGDVRDFFPERAVQQARNEPPTPLLALS